MGVVGRRLGGAGGEVRPGLPGAMASRTLWASTVSAGGMTDEAQTNPDSTGLHLGRVTYPCRDGPPSPPV